MEINTPIAEDIQATDQDAQYDAACKRLLSEKIILAWIMKSCLEEYRNCDVKEIAEKYIETQPQVSKVQVMPDAAPRVRGISSEDTSLTEGTTVYDIRFIALVPSSGELVQMIVNVEAHNVHNVLKPKYPVVKRGIFYCGRMITSQYGTEFTHSEYQKVKKVVSIWICMNPPEDRKNTITRYHMTEENLIGNVKEPLQNYDLIEVVIVCLGDENNDHYDGVLKLLGVLLSPKTEATTKRQVLQDEFDIPMTKTLDEEVHRMCNLSEGVRSLGREEGREEGVIASLKNLIANTGWTLEKAMETLGVPITDRPRYTKLLNR